MLLFCKNYDIKKIQLCITCCFCFFFSKKKIGLEYMNTGDMGLKSSKKKQNTVQEIFVHCH